MTHQTTPDQTPTTTRAKVLDLSLTQLLGGSAAAATAAALGSRLGVVVTIAGAAVLSLVSAVAASLYTASMTRARDAVVLVRSRRGDLEEVPLAAVEPHVAPSSLSPQTWWRRPDRATTRRVLATTGAVFAIAAAFLTGLQLATGAQVTGTSIGGGVSAAAADKAPEGGSGAQSTAPSSSASGTPAASRGDPSGAAGSTGSATQTGTPSADGSGLTGSTTDAAPATTPAAGQTGTQTSATAPGGTPAGGIPTSAGGAPSASP